MPKKTTDQKIDDLALAVGRGFDEIHKKIDFVRKEVHDGFTAVDRRFDKIEFAIAGHDGRINALEDRVRQIATKVGIALN